MTEQTQSAPVKRNFYAERTLDPNTMEVVFTFTDASVTRVPVAQFPESISKHALLQGYNARLGQGMNKAESLAEAKAAVSDAVAQLKEGDWSRGPAANPANRLADAYVQLAREAGMVMTVKAAKDQITLNEKSGVWNQGKKAGQPWEGAATMLAQDKYLKAYSRSQARSEVSLDDIG